MKKRTTVALLLALATFGGVLLAGCSGGDDLTPAKEDPGLKDAPAAPPEAAGGPGAEGDGPGKKGKGGP